MNTTNAVQSVSLYFCEGNSDKVYHASIEASGGGYVVNFAYGRRGSTLNTGSKTPAPVELAKAEKIYNKLVAEKTAKGYTPQEGGVAFAGTANAGRTSGLQPQLLNAVEDAEAQRLILDDNFVAQEKMNGERRMTKDGEGVNRKGLLVPLPAAIASVLKEVLPNGEFDAEQVGDVLYVFDLLRISHRDYRRDGCAERLSILADLFANSASKLTGAIQLVPVAVGTAEKRALYDRVKAANGEGIVFKRKDAPYTPGRPNSGGPQLKHKFVESASVIVSGQNDKRSVRVAVLRGSARIEIGNVTIPPSSEIPAVGAVVEVEYLYAYKGGSLYQPVYLGVRADIDEADCTENQLKFKPEAA